MDPETGKFAGGILSPLSSQRSDGPREAQRPAGRRVGLIAWGALITCLAIAGFIMAAWSTHEAHTASNEVQIASSAVLVADLNHLSQYPGYVLVTNLFRGTGYWAPRPPMPHYRSDFGVVSWNGSAVLFGGLSNDPSNVSIPLVLADVTEYNGVYNTTTPRASMPSNRTRFGWGLVNDKLYVFGGVNDVDGFNVLSDMAMYDLVADQWTSGTAQLNVPRSDSCSGVINGKIYTMGGYGTDNGNTLSSIEEYDPATNTWRLLAQQMSTSRGDCGAVASGGAIYVMGGTVKTPPDCNNPDWWTCYQFQQSMERININADGSATITQLANMTYTRGDFGIIETSPGRLLVAGGETSDPTLNVSRLLAQPWVEEYDVRDNHWTLKAPLPEPSFRFAMARTGDQVLKFGGHPSCTETDQGLDDRCRRNGLNNVVAYSDVVYPNVYVLARTEPPRLHWW